MSEQEQEPTEEQQDATDENPFGDEPDEEGSEETFFGWIAKKTGGDFAAARPIIDRYMRRMQALDAEIGAVTESVDEQIATHEAEADKLRDVRNKLTGDYKQEQTRITWMLEGAWADFPDDIKAILGRGKTWKLTNGSISARAQQPVLAYDEEAAIAFVENLPDLEAQGRLLKHTTSLVRSEMKKLVDILPNGAVAWNGTGEILDFAVAEIRGDAITVTPRPPAAQEGK